MKPKTCATNFLASEQPRPLVCETDGPDSRSLMELHRFLPHGRCTLRLACRLQVGHLGGDSSTHTARQHVDASMWMPACGCQHACSRPKLTWTGRPLCHYLPTYGDSATDTYTRTASPVPAKIRVPNHVCGENDFTPSGICSTTCRAKKTGQDISCPRATPSVQYGCD